MKRKNCQVTVQCTSAEKKLLQERAQQSGHKTLSPYLRELVLQRPVKVYHRDASFDGFVGAMIGLRKELQGMRVQWERAGYPAAPVVSLLQQIEQNTFKIYDLCISMYKPVDISAPS